VRFSSSNEAAAAWRQSRESTTLAGLSLALPDVMELGSLLLKWHTLPFGTAEIYVTNRCNQDFAPFAVIDGDVTVRCR
jgi:hypothetical protein